MPIVDGLTSTKMIRSFEKTHSSHRLSRRAAANGRIPIIAVSASLVERERQIYVDAGFDAWILKPISFVRLEKLVKGIVNFSVRDECLYTPGKWEAGGWFNKPLSPRNAKEQSVTQPDSDKIPPSAPSEELRETAADHKGPLPGDGTADAVPEEQERTFEFSDKGRQRLETARRAGDLKDEMVTPKSFSAPQLGRKGFPPSVRDDGDSGGSGSGSDSTVTPSVSITRNPAVSTPDAM
jgi:CheY-like chemotaxis protein